ncbi:13511_t:CDS:2 [Dentiscutata erythropus]|uniref:13511_t:CDS:1 n=1 Tax=Dentiscutata erythropus TaxID=1348616 RepID=A0A9N8VA97_9GLOM|nr:13511_t:CDS:2 [Dentiscutata erythropus]
MKSNLSLNLKPWLKAMALANKLQAAKLSGRNYVELSRLRRSSNKIWNPEMRIAKIVAKLREKRNIVYSQVPPATITKECQKISDDVGAGVAYLNFSDVKACFESIPFNQTKAAQTIETVKEYFNGFYVFLDQAKENPKQGFTFRPIGLIAELDLLLKKNYTYEYQFVYSVGDLIGELRDGHTAFVSRNYSGYIFYQGFSMYSVIKPDGTQQIKVFDDEIDPSTIDCQVTLIDGEPAIDVITGFARDHTQQSRDLSVRFNYALASLAFGSRDFQIYGQTFTLRLKLPTKPSTSYTLNCNNKVSNITREWRIPSNISNTILDPILSKYKSPYINETSVGNASLIYDAFISRFYVLQDFGVVLISTEDTAGFTPDQVTRFLNDMTVGFKLFVDRGIKKIVFDLSNNTGGGMHISDFILRLLFPNIETFPEDLKVTDVTTAIIEEVANGNLDNLFSYQLFTSTKTNTSFNNVTEFIGNNTYTRGGIQVRYTTKAFRNDSLILNVSEPIKFPWTEENLVILTNGNCGSSCALIVQRLAEIKVPTVSVGGFPNTRFSFASFTGGTMMTSDLIIANYLGVYPNLNNLTSRFTLPDDLLLSFTCAEVYSLNNPDEVMDFSFRQADYQLYYDERSVRDPSSLWIQAEKYIRKR